MPDRYQDPDLWVWLEIFFPKVPHNTWYTVVFPAQYPKQYRESSCCGLKPLLTTKRHSFLFYIGISLPPGNKVICFLKLTLRKYVTQLTGVQTGVMCYQRHESLRNTNLHCREGVRQKGDSFLSPPTPALHTYLLHFAGQRKPHTSMISFVNFQLKSLCLTNNTLVCS